MFPASAGMNRILPMANQDDSNVPRERGDEPSEIERSFFNVRCSPRARG